MTISWLRKTATSLALILAIAAFTRLVFAFYELRRIPSPMLERAALDNEAGSIARSLATGNGFSSPYNRETGPTAILPPVYPLIAAGVFKILGVQSAASFRALLSLNILFATLTCIPIYKLGQLIVGTRLAAAAAWLWALFPNGIVIPFEWIWESSLSAVLAATLLWFTVQLALTAPSPKRWLVYGLLWGFTLMTNPALGAALPILVLWAAWRWRQVDSHALRNAALAFTLALASCVPWTIRNYAVFHRFVPLRSGFGFELYIGNNENYAEPRIFPPRVSYERELLRYIRMGEVPFMDEEKRKALAFIRANPSFAFRLSLDRFIQFWTGTASPIQHLREHSSWDEHMIVLCNLLLPLIVFVGTLRVAHARSTFLVPLLAFPVLFPLIYYITHASLRYRHPLDPCIFLLACMAFPPVQCFRAARAIPDTQSVVSP